MEATSPAPTGSDTAEKTTGIREPSARAFSAVAFCITMATGVATGMMRSTSEAIRSVAIWFMVVASACPL